MAFHPILMRFKFHEMAYFTWYLIHYSICLFVCWCQGWCSIFCFVFDLLALTHFSGGWHSFNFSFSSIFVGLYLTTTESFPRHTTYARYHSHNLLLHPELVVTVVPDLFSFTFVNQLSYFPDFDLFISHDNTSCRCFLYLSQTDQKTNDLVCVDWYFYFGLWCQSKLINSISFCHLMARKLPDECIVLFFILTVSSSDICKLILLWIKFDFETFCMPSRFLLHLASQSFAMKCFFFLIARSSLRLPLTAEFASLSASFTTFRFSHCPIRN